MNPNHFYFFHKTTISMCVCHTSSLVSLNEIARVSTVCYQCRLRMSKFGLFCHRKSILWTKKKNNKSNVPMFIESFLPSIEIGLCALFTGKWEYEHCRMHVVIFHLELFLSITTFRNMNLFFCLIFIC